MSDDSILRTRLEIDKNSYQENLQLHYVQPSRRAAAIVSENLNGIGKTATFGKDVSAQFHLADQNANKFYSSLNAGAKNTTFGRDISVQFDQAERKADSFGSSVKNAFGTFGVAFGASAIIGGTVKVLSDATKAAMEAEKANRILSSSATQAGLSYQFLAEKAEGFAKESGLSQSNANRFEGQIAKLAQAAGKPQDLDKIETALLDTASARGMQVQQLEPLINALITGSSDEPLNNAGLKDPGALAADYAKQIGKSAEALTQQEKVLSRFNPLMEQAAVNTGANADRMKSLSGQAETASAQLDNFYTNLGQGFTQSMEFHNFLSLANAALEAMTTNLRNVKKELAEGATPRQVAEKEANRPVNQFLDVVSDIGTSIGATLLFPYDYATKGFDEAVKLNHRSGIGATHLNRVEKFEQAFTAEQNQLERQNQAAEKQAGSLTEKNFATDFQSRIDGFLKSGSDGVKKAKIAVEDINKLQKEFNANLANFGGAGSDKAKKAQADVNNVAGKFYTDDAESNLKSFFRNPDVEGARQNLQTLENIKKFIPTEKYEEYSDRLSDYIEKDFEKVNQKIKEMEKNSTDLFKNLYQQNGADNPFVKVFSDADAAIDKVRINVEGLSEEMQAAAFAMQEKLNARALFSTRIDNNLAAFDLRERAKELRARPKSPFGLDDPRSAFTNFKIDDPAKFFTDFVEHFTKKLEENAAKSATRYGFDSTFGGTVKVDQNPFTRFHSNIYSDASGNQFTNGFSQSDARNDLLNSYDRVTSADGGFGGFSSRQKSFADLTEEDKRNYFAATQKQEINQGLNERVEQQLSIINSGVFNEDQREIADRKILGLTSGLDPNEISRNLREELALAAEREAGRKGEYERKAAEQRDAQNDYLKDIRDDFRSLKDEFKEKGFDAMKATLEIVDGTNGRFGYETKNLPRTPNSNDTARGMGLRNDVMWMDERGK